MELVDESSSANGSKVKDCKPGLEANGGVGGVGGELNANFPNGIGEGEYGLYGTGSACIDLSGNEEPLSWMWDE